MRDIKLLNKDLQIAIDKLLSECKKQNLPIKITETLRSKEEQDALYAKGRSLPGKIVTNVKYPYSAHCWGVAFDFCRNIKGKEYDNTDVFFDKVGRLATQLFAGTNLELSWGGDWKGFADKPHIQMRKYMPDESTGWLIKNFNTPENFIKTWKNSIHLEKEKVEDDEMIIQKKMIINGKSYDLNVIEKNGKNFVEVAGLNQTDELAVTFDGTNPCISFKEIYPEVILNQEKIDINCLKMNDRLYAKIADLNKSKSVKVSYDNEKVFINTIEGEHESYSY
ncbi:MAG: M15 family metallopeptidase [Filifactoraceae bacterium]